MTYKTLQLILTDVQLFILKVERNVLCTFGIFCLICDYIMEKRENFNAAVKKMFKESLN